jgi:Protein kinase domain
MVQQNCLERFQVLTANPAQESGLAAAQAEASPLRLEDLTFLTCIDRTPLGEIWKVRTPGGKTYLCQVLPHHEPETTEMLLTRLQAFRHPNLIPWMAVHGQDNRLALLFFLDGPTLWDRFQEILAARQTGIPREELLGYFREAAPALDAMQSRYHAQHLCLHPRQFLLKADRVGILAFGLVETWWAHANRPTADLNPRYSAPELMQKTVGPGCDQFSLALIYAELVTGRHPWRGRDGARHPDLTLLTQRDRAVIERALSAEPQDRFDNLCEMVEALDAAGDVTIQPVSLRCLAAPDGFAEHQFPSSVPVQTLDSFVKELVTVAGMQKITPGDMRARFAVGPGAVLTSQKSIGIAAAKLPAIEAFCRQWHAQVIRKEGSALVLAIVSEPSVWQRLQGRRQGLEIRLDFLPLTPGTHRPVVVVSIKPYGWDPQAASQLLLQLGPALLRSMREYLHAMPEQRGRERLPLQERMRISPVVHGLPSDPIECVTKDVSTGGIGFLLPKELAASQVYVNWPDVKALAPYAALAQIVRKQPGADGWFEMGAAFV